jgi:hypothetical protein
MQTENYVPIVNADLISETMQRSEHLTNLHLDLLNKHNLAWSVTSEPLVSTSGKPTNKVGLFRSDNGAHIGTHTSKYHPCQNSEIAKMLIYAASPIEELNLQGSRGGIFQYGKKVYFQIPLPKVRIGNADVERRLTAVNSHDGTIAVALGTTQTVISCQNSFYAAYKSSNMSRVNHTSTMQSKLQKLTQTLRDTIERDYRQVEHFQRMHETQISEGIVNDLRRELFKFETTDDLPTRKENRLAKFDNALQVEFAEQGYNAWGLFNAVTRYTNHMMRPTNTYDGKLANIVIGSGATMNNQAYSYITNRLMNN